MSASNEKFLKLLTRLIDKTKGNQVRWLKLNDASFQVLVTDTSSVDVILYADQASPDVVVASLEVKGETAVSVSAEEGSHGEGEEETYALLKKLFLSAYDCYHEVDTTLNELEKMLDDDKKIGQEAPKRPGDIPF